MESNQVKISYLTDEVRRLNEKLVDYEEMLKLNKDALRYALNLHSPEDAYKKTQDSNHNEEDSQSTKMLKSVIAKLEKENQILNINIERLNREWSISQSKSLINEQIADAAHKHELEVIKDYEKKIKNLYELVSKKEQRIEQLEKTKPAYEHEGLIIQNREIISPNEKVMKLHNELEVQKWALIKMAKEMGKCQEEKKELLTINYNMANEIQKLKSARKLSNSPKNQEVALEQDEAILDFHKKFLNESSSSNQENSPNDSPLPEKITTSATKPNSKPQMKIVNIPKLDLTQAKKIQEINAKKITPQPNLTNVDPQFHEKFKSMENEIVKTKKMLQKEMCQNKMITLELQTLHMENKNLKVKNDTIMNLHRNYEEKWEKISHNFKFYREFYRGCLLKALQNGLSKGFMAFFRYYFPSSSIDKLYENYENLQSVLDLSKLNSQENFDLPLIDIEFSEVFECNPLEYQTENIDSSSSKKTKYQQYLLKLSQDLADINKNPPKILKKVDYVGSMSPRQYMALPLKGRLRRSVSNTLESISSEKKAEFNKMFMFYNQEIVDFNRFKKMMEIKKQQAMNNEYFYPNEEMNVDGEQFVAEGVNE